MERCIYKHVYNFLLKNNIITPHQSGFTPGDSAINRLLSLTNEFGKALDEGKEIRVVFCDISKAFDRVWHKGLLNKLDPRIDHWGTPDLIVRHLECALSIATRCFLSVR
jgi:hypothetical protein